MLDRPTGSATNINATVLVSFDLGGSGYAESLEELRQLAASDGLIIPAVIKDRRSRPDPAYYAGSGKVDEIASVVEQTSASLVIFNHNLSPVQQRNQEQRLQCRVLDRTNLILDIFARRVKSHEGKLQVELAQLEHLATRLVRGWTHLERQKGGIGLRGPGETQLETDRQLLWKRAKLLREKLAKLQRQHKVQRRASNALKLCRFPLSATPTRVNLPRSMALPTRAPTLPINCSPLSMPPRASCSSRGRTLGDFRYSGFHSRIATYTGCCIPCYSEKNSASRHAAICSGCRQP